MSLICVIIDFYCFKRNLFKLEIIGEIVIRINFKVVVV